jgi:hypothetical protein
MLSGIQKFLNQQSTRRGMEQRDSIRLRFQPGNNPISLCEKKARIFFRCTVTMNYIYQ